MVILADCNVNPVDMVHSEWPITMGGEVRVPDLTEGPGWTRHNTSAAGGSIIDYGIFSPGALLFIRRFQLHLAPPWGPHGGRELLPPQFLFCTTIPPGMRAI